MAVPGPGLSRRDGVTPLGDQLREAREGRGVALEQASACTRIRALYLEALERHDWEALPAEVFTRGYVRSYAEYLGLDQERLLKTYMRERRIAGVDGPSGGRDERDAIRAVLERLAKTQGFETRRFGTKGIQWIALGLSGAGVAALGIWFLLPLLEARRNVSTAIEVPPRAARISAAVPHGTAVLAETDASPTPEAALLTEQPPTPPSQSSSASHLSVPEFGVGTGVVHHRLVGQGNQFREGTVVWFWTSVADGRRGDEIRHVWSHEGRSIAVAELAVGGPNWRTHSRRALPVGSTGDWTVEARDPDGNVMARVDFACVAAD